MSYTYCFYLNLLLMSNKLMPQCKDNLLRCFWLGKEFNCQDEKFITVRLTSYGYCCVFNGLKIENATSHDRSVISLKFIMNIFN